MIRLSKSISGDIEMRDFKHPFVSRIYPRWKLHPQGGMVIDAWFIVPGGMNANPNDQFFDKERIEGLADAAIMHAKNKGLTCDIYIIAE